MMIAYAPIDTSFEYNTLPYPSHYQQPKKNYDINLSKKINSIKKPSPIEENGRFSFSSVLINTISDALVNESKVDFQKLKNRFEDIVFNSLSLIDDYLQEETIKKFSITDSKYGINNIFSEMILANIRIHPSAWASIGNLLSKELKENLKIYGNLKLQSGELRLENNFIYVVTEATYTHKKNDDSELIFFEL